MKIILPFVTLLLLLTVNNVYSACKFTTTAATFAFGNLNPGSPVDVNISTTLTFNCVGGPPGTMWTYTLTDDDGLNETGIDANRMINAAAPTSFLIVSFPICAIWASIQDVSCSAFFKEVTIDIC